MAEQQLPVFKCVIDSQLDSDLQVSFIALVDKPAIEKNFMAFNKQKFNFAIDDDKRIVTGPAMIADMLIYRNMEPIGEFYTVFDKATILQCVQKFFKKGFVHNFNLMHDDAQTVPQITVYESFLTDAQRGIMPPKGYEDVSDGSWFISAHVEDDAVWTKIKSGEFKGFSVEGLFQQVPVQMQKLSADNIIERLNQLLSMWNGED